MWSDMCCSLPVTKKHTEKKGKKQKTVSKNEILSIGYFIDILNYAFSQTKGKGLFMEIKYWWKEGK